MEAKKVGGRGEGVGCFRRQEDRMRMLKGQGGGGRRAGERRESVGKRERERGSIKEVKRLGKRVLRRHERGRGECVKEVGGKVRRDWKIVRTGRGGRRRLV